MVKVIWFANEGAQLEGPGVCKRADGRAARKAPKGGASRLVRLGDVRVYSGSGCLGLGPRSIRLEAGTASRTQQGARETQAGLATVE